MVIVHHHFRPGGVRRVIELATPHLVARWPEKVRAVVLAAGEAPDATWLRAFRAALPGVRVEVLVEPAFGYVSELGWSGREIRNRVVAGLRRLLRAASGEARLIWAHNLGLGRNLMLARELTLACHRDGIPLLVHHHDWWLENRWHHFAAMRKRGFHNLEAVAHAVLAALPGVSHAAINQTDAAVLRRHLPGRAGWLPNPAERTARPPAARVDAAREWLCRQLGDAGPVWLLPCRLLRRKNIAEALLLTRWLRPEAWLVTTGAVSSAEEQGYAESLLAATRAHGWRLRLGILRGNESRKPSVPELLVASETVLLTSLQEGFGLPYLEAAAAGRPLVARRLANIAPDLAKFGFVFPQSYREIQVDPSLFDWRSERARQRRLLAEWRSLMPRVAAQMVGTPVVLAAGHEPCAVPFSRLTLTAQLEVLAQPPEISWERCLPLNPFLARWRERSSTGALQASLWPASARRWLGGRVYVRRFLKLVPSRRSRPPRSGASLAAQAELLRLKLRVENLYPLLWNSHS